jgi:hypothetical protein
MEQEVIMSTRRDFLRTVGLGAVVAAMRPAGSTALTETTRSQLPTIRLGNLEVSRLILGSNPFFGFDHGNPQASGDEMREYYTEERIMAVLDQAAEHGITAVWTPCYENWVRVWNRYREKGGKLKIWIGQPDRLPMEREIKIAIKNGAKAIAIQGIRIDDQVNSGKWDVVRGWLELIKSQGLPAGMATHRVTTHLEAEDRGLPADFYHQCLYRPDNYVPEGLKESLGTIEKLPKPVVAYKVLAAGRVSPKERLPYVFKRLKPKDGVCLGVFPKKRDEIAENSSLTLKLTRSIPRQSHL